MRIIGIALMLALATAAWAQDPYSPTNLNDNPKLFVQPEQPPWPEPVPAEQIAPQQQQPAPEIRENVILENPPANERVNVGGREEDHHEQRLFDQWNAPRQTKRGTATVRVVE